MSGQLLAYINDTLVGTLNDVNGIWSFQYASAWLENPARFALSPHLPLQTEVLIDGATQRPVQWYLTICYPKKDSARFLPRMRALMRPMRWDCLAITVPSQRDP